MSLEGCRFGGLGHMAVRVVADSSKKQKLQKRQLASVGYGSRQYIGRKVCTPLPSESACGLAFLCDNAAACSAIGGRQLLFLAEKRKPASCGFEENRNGAPFAHLLEPRCAQSARLSSLGYHERPRKQPGACRDRSDSGLRCRSWRRDPDRSCRTLRRFRKGCRRFAPRTPARFRPAR